MNDANEKPQPVPRLARDVSGEVRCCDNSIEENPNCHIKVSARGYRVTLYIEGGDEWAHMKVRQAERLITLLQRSVTETKARLQQSLVEAEARQNEQRRRKAEAANL